jgi:RNA polymerase sigma factor (sigma-70 family)
MEGMQVPPDATPHGPDGPTHASREHQTAADDDLELLAAVRSGDRSAMSTLYQRHYGAALRTARGVGGPGLADDLVRDAFTRVFTTVLHGSGPNRQLKAYLATTIRHLYVDQIRRSAREFLVGDPEVLDRTQTDDTHGVLEESLVVDLLATLPPRWREILWRTIILGEPPALAGAKMGLNANAAAALGFRARRGLRAAYLASGSGEDVEDVEDQGDRPRARGAG